MPYLQKQMLIFHTQVHVLITASVILSQTFASDGEKATML